MRLIIAAVGRLKDGAERELFGKYRDRFEAAAKRLGMHPVVWHETVESRASAAPTPSGTTSTSNPTSDAVRLISPPPSSSEVPIGMTRRTQRLIL